MAAILHELETSAREVAIRAVGTALDGGAETPPGGRAETALAGLAAAAGAAAIGDSLRQLADALRGADPLTRGWRARAPSPRSRARRRRRRCSSTRR